MEKLKVGLEVSHLVLELEVAVGDEDAEEGAAQAQQGHQQDLVPLGETVTYALKVQYNLMNIKIFGEVGRCAPHTPALIHRRCVQLKLPRL